MQNLQEAKAGLNKMFIAQIGAVVCVLLALIPLVDVLAGLAAWVFVILSLVGLKQAGKDIEGCKTAFLLTIIDLVVTVLHTFLNAGVFGTILSLADTILSLAVIYFVCTSVGETMKQIGASNEAQLGHTVWIINLVCAAVSVVTSILAVIPLLNLIAGLADILVAIASLVGSVLYIIFLYRSSAAI
ncbi:MAG: hypothetical protein NC432_03525 [Roseburia sp.]|nr:hypothetical protein [Roseburia sp.]MCM1098413.1 hypothetical protein [Ruminococcus flavefaciens]